MVRLVHFIWSLRNHVNITGSLVIGGFSQVEKWLLKLTFGTKLITKHEMKSHKKVSSFSTPSQLTDYGRLIKPF